MMEEFLILHLQYREKYGVSSPRTIKGTRTVAHKTWTAGYIGKLDKTRL